MRFFLFTMTLTGVFNVVEGSFMEIKGSNISSHETLPQRSPSMLPQMSKFRSTEADSDGTFDDTFWSDRFQEIRFLEEKLEMIIEELKLFIYGRSFDSAGFHFSADRLFSELTNIRDLAEVTLSPLKSTLQGTVFAQLRYVTSVFYLLVDSAELLDFYLVKPGPAQKLVARLIILNLKLMRLFDSQGQPISCRCKYIDTVARLAKRKKELEEIFSGFKVSNRLRRVFNFYSAQADASLSTLAETIPHFEI